MFVYPIPSGDVATRRPTRKRLKSAHKRRTHQIRAARRTTKTNFEINLLRSRQFLAIKAQYMYVCMCVYVCGEGGDGMGKYLAVKQRRLRRALGAAMLPSKYAPGTISNRASSFSPIVFVVVVVVASTKCRQITTDPHSTYDGA